MSFRVLLAGGREARRDAIGAWLDAAFDLDVESVPGVLDALRVLPNRDFALIVVLAGAPRDGLDLVRFVTRHARHQRTPLIYASSDPDDRNAARALGARLLDDDATEDDVRHLARDILGLG